MAFEKYILNVEGVPHMSIHLLRAFVGEYIEGQKTKAEVLTAIEEHLTSPQEVITLTTDEKSDLQAWMTAVDAETTAEEKRTVADDTYRVLVIAEHSPRTTMYDSVAKLKTRLSWI